MQLEGRKVIINKSLEEIKEFLGSPEKYKSLMPESLKTFEVNDDGFSFELNGMPKVDLKIQEVSDTCVVLSSTKSSINFSLKGNMNPVNSEQTEVQLVFEGKFNPFIKMMVEKPLKNFINSLSDKIENI